jgi:hypothetical protein
VKRGVPELQALGIHEFGEALPNSIRQRCFQNGYVAEVGSSFRPQTSEDPHIVERVDGINETNRKM